MVSKTKLNDTFPTSQFLMQVYSIPFRKNRTSKGVGTPWYFRDDISSKLIKTDTNVYYEGFFLLKLT